MPKFASTPSLTLADIPIGMRVKIIRLGDLPQEKFDHLLAFGLAPGRWVEIKQQRPVVVAQVDYTELALEPEIAEKILVDMPIPIHSRGYFRQRAGSRRRHQRRHLLFRRGRRRQRHRFQFWKNGGNDPKEDGSHND